MTLSLHIPPDNGQYQPLEWFALPDDGAAWKHLGSGHAPGGVHLTKTMMLAELTAVLNRVPDSNPATVRSIVTLDNLLGKPTGTARRLALSRLNTLYGILTPRPIQIAALRLRARNVVGRPLLALLCALAREPLLRRSALPVLGALPGASVRWPDLASAILVEYPDRYSPKMLRSLAQNCVASWTQSGRLRDEYGFTGGLTIVKDYVAGWRQRAQEMFVPLEHPPGHAQVDFGEAIGVIGGVERKIHFFAFDLPHSDACFVVGYPAETTEAFCDGHVRAFSFFGGVPQSILYDNTKIAVACILGDGKRQRTRGFAELQSHYLSGIVLAGLARATTRAKSRGWSVMRDGTSSFRFRSSRASKR